MSTKATQAAKWRIISRLASDISQTHEALGDSPPPALAGNLDALKGHLARLVAEARNTEG
jgi:hypothetical protein